jgi:hypothetical protein
MMHERNRNTAKSAWIGDSNASWWQFLRGARLGREQSLHGARRAREAHWHHRLVRRPPGNTTFEPMR